MKKAVVIGAGISGLSAAKKLADAGMRVTVIEQDGMIGGLSASFKHKDMLLDYGPHKLYSQLAVMDDVKRLMQGRLLEHEKKSKVWLCGRYFNFPLSLVEAGLRLNPFTTLGLGFSYVGAMVGGKKATCYTDYVTSRFGKKAYDLVFGPYAEKVWGDPSRLSPDMAASRVAAPSLLEMVKRTVFGDKDKPELSAKTFFYPRKGLQELHDVYADEIRKAGGRIVTDCACTGFELTGGKITAVKVKHDGKNHAEAADIVVSTMPLVPLLKFLPKDEGARDAAARLQYKDLALLYIVVNKPRLFEESFLFYPGNDVVFNRISEQKAFSPEMVPPGKTTLCVELTHPDYVKAPDKEIFDRAVMDLEKTKILKKEDVADWFIVRVPKAYQIYDLEYKENIATIFSYLDTIENLYSVGRNGAFSYTGMVDCIDMGYKTADFIVSGRPKNQWKDVRTTFYEYKVVD